MVSATTDGKVPWDTTYESGGGGHNMPTGDNDLSDRSAILDSPRVGDTGGGHRYRRLWLIGGAASGMGGFL